MAGKPIVISIQGDDSNLKKALRDASKGIKGFGKTVAGVGIKAGAAFAATAAAVGVKGVTAFADFEKSMNEVMTLLPDAGAEVFDDLSGQVKGFAKEFGVLPSETIPALYQALSAGVPKDNVFEFMEVAQQAAKGGVTDLETAVDGISSVMNAYGDQVESATEVSDLMFTAVRLGKTTFEEMSASMFQVAPIAASLGVPFKDVTTSIANLTAMGVPTSVAATQMKGALAELGKEGTKADVAFRDLTGMGLQQFLEEEGNFAAAVGIMKEGADDMGISVLDMFGSIEAGQAVLALTQDGTESYIETLTEMGGSAGATQGAFETMDRGLGAAFDRIKANLSVLAIEIGERLAPHIEAATVVVLQAFENLGPALVTAKEFVTDLGTEIADRTVPTLRNVAEWVERNQSWLITLAGVVSALVVGYYAYQAALIVVTTAQTVLTAATAAFNLVLNANPISLIVIALVALAGALAAAYLQFEAVRTVVDAVAGFLVDNVLPIFVAFWDHLVAKIVGVWTVFSNFVELVSALFSGDWSDAWHHMKEIAGGVLDLIIENTVGLPLRLLGALAPLGGQLLEWAGTAMGALLDTMTARAGDLVDLFKNLPSLLYTALVDAAVWLLLAGRDIGRKLLEGIGQGLGAAVDWASSIAVDIANALIGFINSVTEDLNSALEFTIPVPFVSDIHINPPDIPSIPSLARGGVALGSTLARIGEGGEPEAIVPLSRASEFGFGGGNTINLTVNAGMGIDPVRVGQEIISVLKQWERHNGSIPLTTSAA